MDGLMDKENLEIVTDKKDSIKIMNQQDLETNKYLTGLIIGVFLSVGFFILIYLYTFGWNMPDAKNELIGKWGTFGDFFGGVLNPILGCASFMALLYTIDLQNKQLKQSADALDLNSKELQNSNRQLEMSANAQKEMEKTQRLQQFEGFFAYMASELRDIYKGLDDETRNVENYLKKSHDELSMKNELRSKFELVRFLMYLYQMLKHIDELDEKFFEFKDKKKYTNIIRASLGNEILQLIYLNCLDFGKKNANDFVEYKRLITNYSFLEHMTFKLNQDENYNYYLVYYSQFYNSLVFDKSYYFKRLTAGFYTNKIKSNSLYVSPVFLIQEIMPKEGLYFVDKITDDFRSIYISFESVNEVKLYNCHERVTHAEWLTKNFTPFMTKRKGNDFFVANLYENSITFKSFTSNNEYRQLSLTFRVSENPLLITGTYSKFIGEVEHLYANGILEKIN